VKRLLTILLLLLTAFAASAQSTRVRGKVLDAETGEPIPFVSVYFEGTTIGISSDLDGSFSLETRSPEATTLTASLIGYYTQTVVVRRGSFTNVDFHLRQDISQLAAATVKPDNRYIKSILRKIDRARAVHNPDNADDWKAGLYTKMEMDATNLEDLIKIGFVNRTVGVIMNYADTSVVTGKAYLPFMISESRSEVYHSKEHGIDRENIIASKISGFKEDNTLSQFTGSYLLKTNFYDSSIGVFDLDIPNPVAASSQMFYNYFLVDSLQVEGRKTYVLRFHPKKLITSPTFDGQMLIDAEDFGIRSVNAQLSDESNVNWIRHINVDIQNRRLPDGRWFSQEEKLFLDFSVTLSDQSKIVSLLANRTKVYDVPEFGPITDPAILDSKNQVIVGNLKEGDAEYWEEVRPYELSDREKGIFKMVDDIQNMPFYKWTYAIVHAITQQYAAIDGWKFEIGRWPRFIVNNDTEGLRLQFGGRTTKYWSKKVRLSGYTAYGFKDKDLKWSGNVEWMLNRETTRRIDIWAKRDFEQLSSGTGVFTAQNMFSSMFARSHASMQSMVRTACVRYEHEFNPDFTASAEVRTMRIWGNESVPLKRQDGTYADSFGSDELRMSFRLSHDEKVTRNYFKKTQVFTKYPVTILNLRYAFKGIAQDTNPYMRADLGIYWDTPTGFLGFGKLTAGGGYIYGSVPYPLLKLHEGNQTYFHDREAFACMNYYEFISDRWINVFYEHNFNGILLGKLPLIKKLDLREVATIRGAWGTLSEANSSNAPFVLPHASGTLEIPYVEAGVGISNIMRFFRVDAFWRLTHRSDTDNAKNFTVNIGIDVDF
jgi:hypothetical protein